MYNIQTVIVWVVTVGGFLCCICFVVFFSCPVFPPPFSLTCSFTVSVSVFVGVATGSCRSRDAPAIHQLITLRLHYPGLFTTPVPDCSVTTFFDLVITAVSPRLDTVSCLCFSLSSCPDPSASLCSAHSVICSSWILPRCRQTTPSSLPALLAPCISVLL